jgi:Zn-dependent peptidase ImmA (M78 family)
MNTELTKEQVLTIIENTFETLTANNKITLKEREQGAEQYFRNKLHEVMFGGKEGFDTYIEIQMYGTNEYPALFIEEQGNFLGQADYKQNRVLININRIMKYVIKVPMDFESIYKKETKFIKRNVTNKKDAVKWIVAHEVAHTLKLDKTHHTNDFFQTVENLYQQL